MNRSVREELNTSLRELLHEELAFGLSQLQLNNEHATTETLSYQDDDIMRTSTEQADSVLGAAIDQGVWDQTAVQAYSEAPNNLSGDAQAEAYRQLSDAIENRDIELTEDVSLY